VASQTDRISAHHGPICKTIATVIRIDIKL